jgi:hypothetical protein
MCIACFNEPGKITKRRATASVPWRKKLGLPVTDEEDLAFKKADSARGRIGRAKARALPAGRARVLVTAAKIRATKKGLKFSLDVEWVQKKIETGKCEVTGIPFDMSPPNGSATNMYAPSLDRTNTKLGYTPDNVKVVVWVYNVAKRDFPPDDISRFVLDFANNLR